MSKRKICVVVTARPSYSRIRTALRAIQHHPDLELQLVVAASALLDRYGNAIQAIEHDGFPIAARVYMVVEGENLVVEPPRRLVQTFHARWSDAADHQGTSRVTWEIEAVGDSCRLLVNHDEHADDAPEDLYGGWPMILSGLKTWLETGQTLTTPGSLMYGSPGS